MDERYRATSRRARWVAFEGGDSLFQDTESGQREQTISTALFGLIVHKRLTEEPRILGKSGDSFSEM